MIQGYVREQQERGEKERALCEGAELIVTRLQKALVMLAEDYLQATGVVIDEAAVANVVKHYVDFIKRQER